MAFLLGSFTNGMFSGLNDVQDAGIKLEKYKQEKLETTRQQDAMDAAEANDVQRKAARGAGADAGAPAAGATTVAPSPSTQPAGPVDRSMRQKELDSVTPQPNHLINTSAVAATGEPGGVPGSAQDVLQRLRSSAVPATTTAAAPAASPLDQERSGYDVQGPNPGTSSTAALPVAPVMTAPSNMPTYDVPESQPGAFSSGQGTPQAAVQTGPVPVARGPGPDLSHPTNRPVGAAVSDWWHGRPPQYLPATPGTTTPAPTTASPVGQGTAGQRIGQRPIGQQPNLAQTTGGLGAQILAAMSQPPQQQGDS